MSYEAWRISFQSSEQAARAAWTESQRLREGIADLDNLLVQAGVIDAQALDDADGFDDGFTRSQIATVKRRLLTPNVEVTGAERASPAKRPCGPQG